MSTIETSSLQRPPATKRLRDAGAIAALAGGVAMTTLVALAIPDQAQAQEKRPNIVMLMTDDTGWSDFGAYGGGTTLGHPTPNVDRMAQEGATFTNWYGQASCTAGRASFITGRIPIRSALSIVVAPGDKNYLRKETPTIAEFFQKNGYATYFSGKWHLGDIPGFLSDRAWLRRDEAFRRLLRRRLRLRRHLEIVSSLVPLLQSGIQKGIRRAWCNLGEWEGVAGQPAKRVGTINYDSLATFDDPADRFGGRLHQAARQGATSRSSWTSISSRCTIRPTRRRTSEESRISATIRIP